MNKKGKTETQLESEFQSELIKRLKAMYPDADILKNDANYKQGIPDLSVNNTNGKYAYLEVKAYEGASHQPNQDYYVEKTNNNGGFARFIYPENEKEVLAEMVEYFTK